MASPSLKITLKLSGPKPPPVTSQPSSPLSNNKNAREEEPSSTETARKRARPNGPNGRSRKPKLEGTPIPDT
jgi:hypothetical protein